MQDIYTTFEFHKIQEHLKEYAKTAIGHQKIDQLVMSKSFDECFDLLEDLKEMMSVVTRFGLMPIATSANALYLIDLAKKTGLLTPRDLNLIAEDVITSEKIVKFIKKIDVSYPRIKAKSDRFYDLTALEKEIHRVITNSLTIADNATPELKEIRQKIRKAEAVLQKQLITLSSTYSAYLNDNNATIRDGHFVLPVKTSDKSKVLGIIHDISDSGSTTFIEPMEIVQTNNTLTALKLEDNEECRKILKQLTALVLLQENEIINNNLIIGEFDFLLAKSLYASEINADVAEFKSQQILNLVEARHPLIDPQKVVSNTYYIDVDKRIVIISGPNAGGKTVSLKTVGLLVLMNQCGLAIPAKKMELGYFPNIYVDIGDNQSLSDNLSTFSAHMSNIAHIINKVKGKDLVLLDELGTGTDPKEGEALAIAVVKYLENKNVFAMVSSHFDALKEYAFLHQNIENSSMAFDENNLTPTYRFRLGTPGHSYALDVATRYGIDNDIIDDARDFLKRNSQTDVSELLLILQKKVEETTKLEEKLQRLEKELVDKTKKIENDEKLLKQRRDSLLEDVENEKSQIIQNAKDEIKFILSKLSNGDIKLHEVIALKKELEELEDSPESIDYNEEVKVNDYVSIPTLNISGKIMRIQGNKARIQGDNGMAFDVEIKKLHKISSPKVTNKLKSHQPYDALIKSNVGLELNIIGQRVDEAKINLEKYIDDCRLKHFQTVRIIHGFGSGALRKMTHEYLSKQKDLTFALGSMHDGGGGATVITFKK